MPKQITRWVTRDNREFTTQEKANAHESTLDLIALLLNRPSGASENNAIYEAFFHAFLKGYIIRTNQPVK